MSILKKISKNFIIELLSRTNIVELIHSKLTLKKKGKDFHTFCPFHNEKTPSFTVSNEKQFYYCFGCNAHGNAIDFLMNYNHLNFLEAIEELSIINGMSISSNDNYTFNNKEYVKKIELYSILKKVSTLYNNNINQYIGKPALSYLFNRGINANMINFFSIGYVPQKKYNFLNKSKNNLPFSKKRLIEAGIITTRTTDTYYHFFQNRITFPIKDKHGRITGFGGRALNNIFPKYLNSPETIIFKKKNQLFGLYEVLQTNKKIDQLLIVEGYIDVIMLFQFNINYTIAILGTSLTSKHIQTLFTIADNIIYCYDGDSAGRIATWNALTLSLPYLKDNKNIKFIFLPEGEDPDSIVRKEGKIGFEYRIHNAKPMSKFLFEKLQKNINLSSIEEKSRFSSMAISLIKKIPGKIMKTLLRQKLGNKIGILNNIQLKKFFLIQKRKINNIEQTYIKYTTIKILISLLVQNPWLAKKIPKTINFLHFKTSGLTFFLELVNICIKNNNIHTGQLIELYRNSKKFKTIKKIAKWDHMITKKEIQNVFLDSLDNLHNKKLEIQREFLISKERIHGLSKTEKIKLWNISKKLSKNTN